MATTTFRSDGLPHRGVASALQRPLTLGNGLLRHAVARLTGANVWSAVTFLITLRCNLRCRYCDFPRHADRELGTDEIERLLAGLRRDGTFRLGISGGEPLLREDLGDVLRRAVDLGFMTSVVTNALLLEDRLDDVAPAQFVLTTIEGDAAAHERIRGKRSWTKTIQGLEALRRRQGPKLGVICPIHRGNLHALEEPLRVAEQLGIKAFYQPVEIRDGWKGRPFDDQLTWEQANEAFRTLLGWKQAGRPIGNSSAYLRLMTAGERPKIRDVCPAGRYVVTILPDGRATPCCMVPFEDGVPIADLDRPAGTHALLTTPPCQNCTISPYVEYHLLLKPDLSAVWEALSW